jgi:hypothetical protein
MNADNIDNQITSIAGDSDAITAAPMLTQAALELVATRLRPLIS